LLPTNETTNIWCSIVSTINKNFNGYEGCNKEGRKRGGVEENNEECNEGNPATGKVMTN
jgi:hypothetical protein